MKLLCWVVLNEDELNTYVAINDTWGRHCSKTLFFTSHQNPVKGTINIELGRLDSWSGTHEIIKYIAAKGYLDEYDWFVRGEEDTYIIVENLLYYLSVRNATDSLYIGHTYTGWGSTYNSAGSGYVLSKAAFRKLQTVILKGQCRPSSFAEDVSLGTCLGGIGIGVEDTRDVYGRGRFLMFHPESLLVKGNLPWTESFWARTKYPSPEVRYLSFNLLFSPNFFFSMPVSHYAFCFLCELE